MSRQNVQTAQTALAAVNRRDWGALYELITPDFEWVPAVQTAIDNDAFKGREGVEAYARGLEETWSSLSAAVEDFRDLGDRVVLLGRVEARGVSSGVELEAPWAPICDFREGRICRVRVFLDHGEALRAAGIEA